MFFGSVFECNVWKRKFAQIYLSENYICFLIEKSEKIKIRWKHIKVIKKRKLLIKDNSISIEYKKNVKKAKGEAEELFFYSFNEPRDQVFDILDKFWQTSMEKSIRAAEVNSTNSALATRSTSQQGLYVFLVDSSAIISVFIRYLGKGKKKRNMTKKSIEHSDYRRKNI